MRATQAIRAVRALGAADAASIWRDPLLRGMIVVPLGLALAARALSAEAVGRLAALVGPEAAARYPQFVGYVLLLLPAAICGMVIGVLLLDQRDERTLLALRVTPLPAWGYLAYRLALPMALSVTMTAIGLPLSGAAALTPATLLAVVAAAPLGPAMALFLAAFGENKVQGLALQKALGVLLVLPALAEFLPAPWPLLAAALPTYWPALALREAAEGVVRPDALLVAMGYQLVLLILLLRRFAARA
jgi:fluoroquinolone transport system permease protein